MDEEFQALFAEAHALALQCARHSRAGRELDALSAERQFYACLEAHRRAGEALLTSAYAAIGAAQDDAARLLAQAHYDELKQLSSHMTNELREALGQR